MDKRKSILNVCVSVSFKLITMIMVIVVKRLLIQICGNEVNGLNALYLSIVGFLAVAELGVGDAISFCMYKPIVEGNHQQVTALYQLFKRLYILIGAIILAAGLIIAPNVAYFAVDYAQVNVDMQRTFVLMLISVVITYCFGAKTSLINAHKNNYITTAINSGGIMLQYILQIVVLVTQRSFEGYLVCRSVAALVQWLITEIIARRKHAAVIHSTRQKLDASIKKKLVQSIRAMFMHNVGYILVNTVDSVVISWFVGVIALGEYSNYATILASLNGVLVLVFTSLTSVVGHLYAQEDRETSRKYCSAFHTLNFMIGSVFFLGYYAVVDNLIALLFGEHLVVAKQISFTITLNGFVQFMRRSILLFRYATGTFYNDRWKPLLEGVVNIVLSIAMVKMIGIAGVIVATIATNLTICHVIEPYVLYKYGFSHSPALYYKKNYAMIALFIGMLLLLNSLMVDMGNQWQEFLANGSISVGLSSVACILAAVENKDIKKVIQEMKKR